MSRFFTQQEKNRRRAREEVSGCLAIYIIMLWTALRGNESYCGNTFVSTSGLLMVRNSQHLKLSVHLMGAYGWNTLTFQQSILSQYSVFPVFVLGQVMYNLLCV